MKSYLAITDTAEASCSYIFNIRSATLSSLLAYLHSVLSLVGPSKVHRFVYLLKFTYGDLHHFNTNFSFTNTRLLLYGKRQDKNIKL